MPASCLGCNFHIIVSMHWKTAKKKKKATPDLFDRVILEWKGGNTKVAMNQIYNSNDVHLMCIPKMTLHLNVSVLRVLTRD